MRGVIKERFACGDFCEGKFLKKYLTSFDVLAKFKNLCNF
jgi:hypothetical protein